MELFWTRVGRANTQNLALIEEKRTLTQQNEWLRNSIRQYCTQKALNNTIASLRISPFATVITPFQEASHMTQINKHDKHK